ncbi:T9SS type A sorting domain-containing protein, partial [candidate division KSB1 bacterium]|nr:T9SS type A sorting domain-containing protein [candidate division KSB1 bacterium]NIW69548.1 T9SS type A sorting domain-containing protein [candidate division KSB1 bacterium]
PLWQSGIRSEIAAFQEYQRKSESILNALFRSGQVRKQDQIPQKFQLLQNFPNPFNPTTTIKYQLPKTTNVRLEIYNILGQRIKTLVDAQQPADYYTIQWDGRNNHGVQVGSGLYIYRLIAEAVDGSENFVKVRKMLLVR